MNIRPIVPSRAQWVDKLSTERTRGHRAGTFDAVTPEASFPMPSRTLDNGLRVVVSPTPGLGVVAVNLWYDVGSRHEQPHRQGFAHLFEHLMFQGSRHVAAGDHFALIQGIGGISQRHHVLRPHQLLRVRAGRSARPGAVARGRPDGLPRRRAHQDELQEPGGRRCAERSQRMDNVPYGTVFERAAAADLRRRPPVRTPADRQHGSNWRRPRSTR